MSPGKANTSGQTSLSREITKTVVALGQLNAAFENPAPALPEKVEHLHLHKGDNVIQVVEERFEKLKRAHRQLEELQAEELTPTPLRIEQQGEKTA